MARISASPRGAPWAWWVFCLVGAGKPMIVRQSMRVGLPQGRQASWKALVERPQVLAVGHLQHPPALGFEARGHVLGEGQPGPPLDGDAVVVVEQDQLLQGQVPRQAGGLLGHPFHHVPVPGEGEGAVVHHLEPGAVEPLRQPALGHGHAHGVADALAQGPGGGLHPGGVPVLRMPRRAGAPLAELLEVLQGQAVARPGAAGNRAAWTRGRRRARSGPGPPRRGRPGCASGTGSTARRPPGPGPWGFRGGRCWPSAPRPWPGSAPCRCRVYRYSWPRRSQGPRWKLEG